MGGGGFDPANGHYMGPWGAFGSPTQKGVTTYSLSPNRQKPLAGALKNAFFNTFRRTRGQILYVVPPFVIGYLAMEWAIKENHYWNSKPGRLEQEELDKAAEAAAAAAKAKK